MRIEITQDLEGIKELLEKLDKRRLEGAFKNIGEAGVKLVRESFRGSVDPYGQSWKPIKPYTRHLGGGRKRERKATDKPLVDLGLLRNSFNAQLADGGVEIGTPFAFYRYHQGEPGSTGRGILPRRAALPDADRPLPKAWQSEILGSLEDYLGLQQ